MNWFAFQKSPNGEVPVAFDEHPDLTPTMAGDLIKATLRPIPPELRDAPLSALADWAMARPR
jgi:hypothetical protein